MEKLEARVNQLENTLTTVISKLHDLSGSVASGFEKIDKNFGIIISRLGAIETRLGFVETRLGVIEISLKEMRGNLQEMRGNSTASLETVEEKITGLTTEISKINEVTNYEGQFDNLKVVKK